MKPRQNDDVNGHWMCDKGRDIYKFVNRKYRITKGKFGHKDQWEQAEPAEMAKRAGDKLAEQAKVGTADMALVLTANTPMKSTKVHFLTSVVILELKMSITGMNNPEDQDGFDGHLFRGDRNPNTAGLKVAMKKHGVGSDWADLQSKLDAGNVSFLLWPVQKTMRYSLI